MAKRGPKPKYERVAANKEGAPLLGVRLEPEIYQSVKAQPGGPRSYLEGLVRADLVQLDPDSRQLFKRLIKETLAEKPPNVSDAEWLQSWGEFFQSHIETELYFQERERANQPRDFKLALARAQGWLEKADSIKRAAEVLWEHEVADGGSNCVNVLLMLCGNCLEALLKGIILSTQEGYQEANGLLRLKENLRKHKLLPLWQEAFGKSPTQETAKFLNRLSDTVMTHGRYPVPAESTKPLYWMYRHPNDWQDFRKLELFARRRLAKIAAAQVDPTTDGPAVHSTDVL